MESKKIKYVFSPRIFFNAMAAWLICAILMTAAGAAVICLAELSFSALSYISSAISFISAFVAGMVFMSRQSSKPFIQALLLSVLILFVVFTVGLAVGNGGLSTDSVISVSAFTISGCLLGSVLANKKEKQRRNKSILKRR